MKCDEARELIPAYLYGELDGQGRSEFERHVADCPECTAEIAEFRRILNLVGRGVRPEPTPAEWQAFDRRLDDALGLSAGPVRARSVPPGWIPIRPAWAYGIAAILLIGFGLFMGKLYFGGNQVDIAGGTGETAIPGTIESHLPQNDLAAEREALAWLERTRTLLMGVTNLDDRQARTIDLARYTQVSHELYDRGNTVAAALNSPSKQQLRRLIIQLQVILLQLSNVGEGGEVPAIEVIRRGVDSKSLLLKINLETIRAAMNDAEGGEEALDGWPDTAATDGNAPGKSAGPGRSKL